MNPYLETLLSDYKNPADISIKKKGDKNYL